LARATGTDATSLYRLLRTLASRGIFAEDSGHRFTLTDAALPLRTDAPGSVRAAVIVWGHPMQWLPWGKLLDSVRTGKPAFPSVFGVDHYEYLTTHAEDAAIFHAAMAGSQRHVHLAAALRHVDGTAYHRLSAVETVASSPRCSRLIPMRGACCSTNHMSSLPPVKY
jgi:hypothetical protein